MVLTFVQKQIRGAEKKKRENEMKYKKTGNKKYLIERDKWDDKVKELKMNMNKDKNRRMMIQKEKLKTDDQILNEAIKENRSINTELNENKGEEKKEQQNEKIDSKREALRMKILAEKKGRVRGMHETNMDLKMEEEIYINEYIKKNPTKNKSNARKKFLKHKENEKNEKSYKQYVINFFTELNIDNEYGDISHIPEHFDKELLEYTKKNETCSRSYIFSQFEKLMNDKLKYIHYRHLCIKENMKNNNMTFNESYNDFEKKNSMASKDIE
tara:strand:+ start:124 stop:933 length:810 start_codon:yes stop_codon:yes gene_type:complete